MANPDEQETSGFLLLMLLAQELTNVSADKAREREPHVPHDGTGLTDVC